jgi:hypothetical protein
MPKVALAETFYDWESLLRAAEELRDQKGLHEHLDKLQVAYDRLRELDAFRDSLRAQRQRATQEMREVKDAGKVAAVEVRSLLTGIFGHGSERLVQFNMRPRRKRGPRRKASTETKPSP